MQEHFEVCRNLLNFPDLVSKKLGQVNRAHEELTRE